MRSSVVLALAVCAGCVVEREEGDVESAPLGAQQLLFPPTMTLTTTPWVGTLATKVTVTGAPPNTKVILLGSSNLVGANVCSPKTAPMCFDIAAPLLTLATKKSDATGTVTYTITVANPVIAPDLEIQAVVVAPPQKSASQVVTLHNLGSDKDNDGLLAEDEVQVWFTDPSIDDTDGDAFDDGTEATGGTDPLDAADFPLTYDDDIHPDIFLVECTPCHVNGGVNGGLNLDKFKDIVNEPSSDVPTMDRVEPFDPDNSYLWHKLNNTQLTVGGAGLQMPRNGPPFLTVDQLALVEDWILAGALEAADH